MKIIKKKSKKFSKKDLTKKKSFRKKINRKFRGGAGLAEERFHRPLEPKLKEEIQQQVKSYAEKEQFQSEKIMEGDIPPYKLIIWVWWEFEKKWFRGIVIDNESFNIGKGKQKGVSILYDDNEAWSYTEKLWKGTKWKYGSLRQQQLHEAMTPLSGIVFDFSEIN